MYLPRGSESSALPRGWARLVVAMNVVLAIVRVSVCTGRFQRKESSETRHYKSDKPMAVC